MLLIGKFKPVFHIFAQVTAGFCFVLVLNWQSYVDNRRCLPLPSDYMKSVIFINRFVQNGQVH